MLSHRQRNVRNHDGLCGEIRVVQIGSSYLGEGLRVLKITNFSLLGGRKRKGVMFATFGLHAREYAPPELGTRLAEYLVDSYGTIAEVTALLDRTEVHLLLQANPDGRRIAEANRKAWWRKNGNPSNGCGGGRKFGVDLNRNFDFKWGKDGGSSSDPCAAVYRGPKAYSEPETWAIAAYSRKIFPAGQRRKNDPEKNFNALRDEEGLRGMFLDVHSHGELNIWPWGFRNKKVRNFDSYRALGYKMTSFNGYTPSGSGTPEFLYRASGDSIGEQNATNCP